MPEKPEEPALNGTSTLHRTPKSPRDERALECTASCRNEKPRSHRASQLRAPLPSGFPQGSFRVPSVQRQPGRKERKLPKAAACVSVCVCVRPLNTLTLPDKGFQTQKLHSPFLSVWGGRAAVAMAMHLLLRLICVGHL